jgi:hypothetical protein
MRRHPHLYQINVLPFMNRLSAKYGRRLTLSTIPDEEWQSLARKGFDLMWLMGIWQRSHESRDLALANDPLHREFDRALPDWTPQDVAGSAYAICGYGVDLHLGTQSELAKLKKNLNRLGLGLVVDFIPNHLAVDHPWVRTRPGMFVHGKPEDVRKHPDWFYPLDHGTYLAHGRDPYYPPWHDTVQVNFFSASLRKALFTELIRISSAADGVRCDMAMLGLNDVFASVWGHTLSNRRRPTSELWEDVIGPLKKVHPDFLFIAEAYWGLETRLQELGFDFTYDKTLYDLLRHNTAVEVLGHIDVQGRSLARGVHFTENHDETRAIAAFGRDRSLAAAIVLATVPGIRFYQDGQLEGHSIRLPVHLARGPAEVDDAEVKAFYERLLTITNTSAFHEGEWRPIGVEPAWPGNGSHRDLLAWQWDYANTRKVVAVNYSAHQAQGWLSFVPFSRPGEEITLRDELTDVRYTRKTDELSTKGLYVDLAPYRAHIMDVLP